MELVLGACAGTGAVLFSNPLDLIKTRLQLQGELQARGKHAVHYKHSLHAAYVIAKTESVLALQKGLVPAVWFQILMNSLRLGLFDIAEKRQWCKNKNGEVSLFRSAVAGGVSGVIGTVVASPAYLVKVQIQSYAHNSIAVGDQHGHKGTLDALVNIYRKGGIRGCYQGFNSAVWRGGVASSTQLATFTWSKDFIKSQGICESSPIGLAFVSSALSSVAAALAMSPFDVVATRLYNQGDKKYNGVYDCLVKIYKTEGFLGYYKGVGSLYFRLAPHTILSLVFWDKLKFVFDSFSKKQEHS